MTGSQSRFSVDFGDWLTRVPIAHRGYHDLKLGLAENSMGAFRAAVEAGFAVECDLQVSATGEPVVFHDPTLKRMTGVRGNVRDKTPDELAQLKLLDTDDTIRTLEEHLKLVSGAVPLVLELKGVEGKDQGFVEGVAAALARYDGPVAVMSFDHWICAQFKQLMPNIPRGLTAEGTDRRYHVHRDAMKEYDLQFVSYSVKHLPCRFVSEAREAGLPIITWTVRDEKTRRTTFEHADQMTFEGFDPREVESVFTQESEQI
ncbi:MAG: glycerophosphodiester phosphodiesterase family protein [Pseudomonadota bacterium]